MMADETGCLRRFQSLLAVQIKKAKLLRGGKGESGLSKDTGESQLEYRDNPITSPGDAQQAKTIPETTALFKSSPEDIELPIAVTQPPRKRKASISYLLSDDYGFNSPEKIFIVAAGGQEEADTNVSNIALSECKSDVSDSPPTAHGATEITSGRKQSFTERAEGTEEKVQSHREDGTVTAHPLQNESGISSIKFTKVNDLGTNHSRMPTSMHCVSGDEESKLRQKDIRRGFGDGLMVQKFDARIQECRLHGNSGCISHQSNTFPCGEHHLVNQTGRAEVCPPETVREATSAAKNIDRDIRAKCRADCTENVSTFTANTLTDQKNVANIEGKEKKLKSVDCEWEYDCDHIQRLLLPVRKARDQGQLTLFQELQQAEQQQHKMNKDEDNSTPRLATVGRCPFLQCPQKRDASQHTAMTQDSENQISRPVQLQEKNIQIKESKESGAIVENSCSTFHKRDNTNTVSNKCTSPNFDCHSTNLSLLLSESCPQEEKPLNKILHLHDDSHYLADDDMTTGSACKKDTEIELNNEYFDAVSVTTDAVGADIKQGIFASNVLVTSDIKVAMLSDSELDLSDYEDCHSELDELDSGDCLLIAQKHSVSAISDVNLSEEKNAPFLEDSGHNAFLATIPDRPFTDNAKDCRTCQQECSDTGHGLCLYLLAGLATMVDEIGNVDDLCRSVPSEIPVSMDMRTDTQFLKPQLVSTMMLPHTNWPHRHENDQPVYDDAQKLYASSIMNSTMPELIPMSDYLESKEQFAHCLLTFNNNSLPSDGKGNSNINSKTQSSICVTGNRDYLLEYNYTHRGKISTPSVLPFQRRKTQVTQNFGESVLGINGRCRQNAERLSFRRHLVPKVQSDLITNGISAANHPQNCKCLENDCLRRRGELLHEHVMKNLHVLKKFASNGSNQRSNFSIQIKEAIGNKARELIQKQRSEICRQPQCTPTVKKSSRSLCSPARRQKTVHTIKDGLKFSSSEQLSKGQPYTPKVLREQRGLVNYPLTYPRATATYSACAVSKKAWTLKNDFNENPRTITNCSQSTATDSDIKVPTQENDKLEMKSQAPKDRLHENNVRGFVNDLIALEIEQKGQGSTKSEHLKGALKRLQALNQVDEECDKLIQRLQEFRRQRMTVCRQDNENKRQTPTALNLQLSDNKQPVKVGDTGLYSNKSPLYRPSSTYFLSVKVPKPTLYNKSLQRLALLPRTKPGEVSHKTKNILTRLGQKKVTREVEEHRYNPVTGRTSSYFYSLSQEDDEQDGNSSPISGDSDANKRDTMPRDDSLPSYSTQNQMSKHTMATIGVQTSSKEAADRLHTPSIINIDSDDELNTDADIAQSLCSKDGLLSEILVSNAHESKNPQPFYHYSESKTSVEMCTPSGSTQSVKIMADEEIIHTVSSANQIPWPAITEDQVQTPDKAIIQKENADGSEIQAQPLPIAIVSDFCEDIAPHISITMERLDKTTQTQLPQSDTKIQVTYGTTSRSSSPAPSIDSKTSEGFAYTSPCSQTSSCLTKSGKHFVNSPESPGTRLYESSSCQDSNISLFTSSGKKSSNSPSSIQALERVYLKSQTSSMTMSPDGSYYASQPASRTKKDTTGDISSSTGSRSGGSKSSSPRAYKKSSTKTSSCHSPTLGSKASSSSGSFSPKRKIKDGTSSPSQRSLSSAPSRKSKPTATIIDCPPTPSIKTALEAPMFNDNHKELAMHSSVGETSSAAPMSSISIVSDSSVRSVTFSKSSETVHAGLTPSRTCPTTTSSLMNTLQSMLKQLKSYVSLAADSFRGTGAHRANESETLIPDSSESHPLLSSATGVKSNSFVGQEHLCAKYQNQIGIQPVASTESQTESTHTVSQTLTSAEGSYLTTQHGQTQTIPSSSSESHQASISEVSGGLRSSTTTVNIKSTVTRSEKRQLSAESVASQSMHIKLSHRSLEERFQTPASETPSPFGQSCSSCPSSEAARTSSTCNQSDPVPQRTYTGRKAVLRLALILQHLSHAVQPYGPAVKRTVMMAALVAMVTAGYLCGYHCCLDSLALRSSVSLERLLEDIMMHLTLRNVAVPPF